MTRPTRVHHSSDDMEEDLDDIIPNSPRTVARYSSHAPALATAGPHQPPPMHPTGLPPPPPVLHGARGHPPQATPPSSSPQVVVQLSNNVQLAAGPDPSQAPLSNSRE